MKRTIGVWTVRRAALLLQMACCTWMLGSCEPDRTIRVTTLTDGGEGSLRAAIDRINAEPSASGATVIELGAGTYELTRCGNDEMNASGDLDLRSDLPVSLVAKADNVVIRQKCDQERVLDKYGSGPLALIGVTITGGSVFEPNPSLPGLGGGLRAQGDVTLDHATVTGNEAGGSSAFGGGLYVGGSLQGWQSTLAGNRTRSVAPPSPLRAGPSEGGGAFVQGAITLVGGSVENNSAVAGSGSATLAPGSASGGGIAQAPRSSAPVSLTAVSLVGNSAQGGAVAGDGNGGAATGGALAVSGPLHATSITATQNTALGGGSSAPTGYPFPPPGAFVVVGGGSARGGALATTGSAAIIGGQFSNNRVTTPHRGTTSVRNAPPPDLYCRGTSASSSPGAALGGAIWVGQSAALMDGSYVENSATASALLVDTCSGSSCVFPFPPCADAGLFLVSRGGAVAVDGGLTLEGGDYAGNGAHAAGNRGPDGAALSALGDANVTGADIHDSQGIGFSLHVARRLRLSETQVLGSVGSGVDAYAIEARNVTIANNGARGLGGAEVSLVNATVIGNAEYGVVGGAFLSLRHSTIADNWINLNAPQLSSHASVVIAREGSTNCWADLVAVSSSSYNWFSDDSCGLTGVGDRQENAAFLLGPLADNGGAILTRAPELASVLVDLIPAASCPDAMDARGVARPQGTACDVGAVELTQ